MRALYWGVTGLMMVAVLGSSVGSFVGAEPVVKAFARLGLPSHLMILIGVAKLLAVIGLGLTLWRPSLWRLREWVYAGLTFNMLGAIWCHVAAGDSVGQTMGPMVFLALVLASWTLGVVRQKGQPATG